MVPPVNVPVDGHAQGQGTRASRSRAQRKVRELEHSWVLWAYLGAFTLLAYMITGIGALAGAFPYWVFYLTWGFAMVAAVFVIPMWALSWLGGVEEFNEW